MSVEDESTPHPLRFWRRDEMFWSFQLVGLIALVAYSAVAFGAGGALATACLITPLPIIGRLRRAIARAEEPTEEHKRKALEHLVKALVILFLALAIGTVTIVSLTAPQPIYVIVAAVASVTLWSQLVEIWMIWLCYRWPALGLTG